jgi:monoamine oxidase
LGWGGGHGLARRRRLNKRQFDIVYPGYRSHQQSQKFCLWPYARWSNCGYSAPAVGQLSKVFLRLEGGWQDKLLLASEYGSPDFYGYMEGGLNRGAVLAGRLARQFNLAQSG